MNHKALFLIAACVQLHMHAVVTVKSPVPTTVPLRAKVYGINNTETYRIQKSEKPALFKPFDNMVTNYSWKYVSKARPNELGYVLVGYDGKNKAAAKESGAAIFDPTRSQLTEPTPEVTVTPTTAAPNPAQPAPIPTANAQITAPVTQAPITSEPVPATIKNEIDVPQDPKQLLLELNVMCTNIPGVPLRKKQIEDAIQGGKVYGTSFDLKKHKQCYIVAKKYKDDAPAPEIQEFIEKIYGGVLGVGGALEL